MEAKPDLRPDTGTVLIERKGNFNLQDKSLPGIPPYIS